MYSRDRRWVYDGFNMLDIQKEQWRTEDVTSKIRSRYRNNRELLQYFCQIALIYFVETLCKYFFSFIQIAIIGFYNKKLRQLSEHNNSVHRHAIYSEQCNVTVWECLSHCPFFCCMPASSPNQSSFTQCYRCCLFLHLPLIVCFAIQCLRISEANVVVMDMLLVHLDDRW